MATLEKTSEDQVEVTLAADSSTWDEVLLWNRSCAKVAELADAPALGAGSRKAMRVQVPAFALTNNMGEFAIW